METSNELATITNGRAYRSKKQRPCDSCRQRKTCCVINDKPPCFTCSRKGIDCLFSQVSFSKGSKKARTQATTIRFYVPEMESKPIQESAKHKKRKTFIIDNNDVVDSSTTTLSPLINDQEKELVTKGIATIVTNKGDNVIENFNIEDEKLSDQVQLMNKDDSSSNLDLDFAERFDPIISDENTGETQNLSNQDNLYSLEFDLPLAEDMWNQLFQDLENSTLDSDLKNRSRAYIKNLEKSKPNLSKHAIAQKENKMESCFHVQSQEINRFGVRSIDEMEQYNEGSIDADETLRAQFMDKNSYLDPHVYSKLQFKNNLIQAFKLNIRNLADNPSFCLPMLHVTQFSGYSKQNIINKEEIHTLIGKSGPRLLLLFFRHINPFLPVFSRGRFYFGTNQNLVDFHTSLLSNVLNLAMDWWAKDPILSLQNPPSSEHLLRIARSSIMEETNKPNYSCLQACILLSQKRLEDMNSIDTPFVWSILGMACSIAQSMGFDKECLEWKIPDWEKRVRRRIWWTLMIQDTWFAVSYGKPTHLNRDSWNITKLGSSDFASYCINEVEAENHQKAVSSFCYISELTIIVMDISTDLLGSQARNFSFEPAYEIGCILLRRISKLKDICPSNLKIEYFENFQMPSADGSIQLAIYSAQIFILKDLLHRIMSHDREKYRPFFGIIYSRSLDCLRQTVDLVGQLKTIHFQYFWYSWSRLNFALISNFFLLVYAVTESIPEKKIIKKLMDNYRWLLRCSAPTFSDMSLGLSILDSAYAIGLDDLCC